MSWTTTRGRWPDGGDYDNSSKNKAEQSMKKQKAFTHKEEDGAALNIWFTSLGRLVRWSLREEGMHSSKEKNVTATWRWRNKADDRWWWCCVEATQTTPTVREGDELLMMKMMVLATRRGRRCSMKKVSCWWWLSRERDSLEIGRVGEEDKGRW